MHKKNYLQEFFKLEAASGIVLFACAVAALVWANSPLAASYHALWQVSVAGLSLHHWMNDGLMAIFFLVVGLEIKEDARPRVPGRSIPAQVVELIEVLVVQIVNQHVPITARERQTDDGERCMDELVHVHQHADAHEEEVDFVNHPWNKETIANLRLSLCLYKRKSILIYQFLFP